MQPCLGDACDFVELWTHDSVWFVQNLHLSKSVRVEFDAVWGGLTYCLDLKPREEQILTFTEFYGNWHANFIKKD
jgi:hypothetical protein